MNAHIGSIALGVAFVATLLTLAISLYAARTRSRRYTEVSRYGVYVVFGAVLVASAVLLRALITQDYSLHYVHNYTDDRMPLVYLVAAFWGGQAGSLLFWTIILTACSALAVTISRERVPELMPVVHALLMGITSFFLFLLVFLSNPFETYYLMDLPTAGEGLNPVLQNYWMAIHPPSLLTGYSTFAIPFAFGAAALIKRQPGVEWIRVTRRWLLLSWMFLSLGCILGARWAYEELGWGGYWAWDPVENAAILPWFTATALLHSVMIQERRGMLKRWNFSLLVLTFWLTIFGTFLTRSGMIASVHTFAESAIGPAFLGAVIFVAVAGAGLLALRWKALAGERRLESTVSREAVFLLNNWLMLAFMFMVIWGTLGPKVKDLFAGSDTTLGPPWFNKFAVPLGLAALLAMSLGTLVAWRKATKANISKNFGPPFLVAVVLTPLLGVAYYFLRLRALDPDTSVNNATLAAVALFFGVFGLAIIVTEFWRGVATRRSKHGEGVFTALGNLFSKHRRRYGGYLVHAGFIFLCLGIAGNAFKVKAHATLEVGDTVALGDYLLAFDGWATDSTEHYSAEVATLSMRHCDRVDGQLDPATCGDARVVRPARFDYNDYSRGGMGDPMKRTSEIAIVSGPLEDVYIAISGGSRGGQVASFEMYVNPFTFWVWLGGVLLVVASIVCMWPETAPARHRVRLTRLEPAFDRLAMLFIAALPIAASLSGDAAWAQSADTRAANAIAAEADHDHDHDHDHPVESRTAVDGAIVDASRVEGSAAAYVYSMVLCRCSGCGGKTIDQCQPSCGEGREDRNRVDELLTEGMTAQQILDVFVAERGQSAIAIPSDKSVAWGIPIAVMLAGFLGLAWLARSLTRGRRHVAEVGGHSPKLATAAAAAGGGYRDRLAAELAELD